MNEQKLHNPRKLTRMNLNDSTVNQIQDVFDNVPGSISVECIVLQPGY